MNTFISSKSDLKVGHVAEPRVQLIYEYLSYFLMAGKDQKFLCVRLVFK